MCVYPEGDAEMKTPTVQKAVVAIASDPFDMKFLLAPDGGGSALATLTMDNGEVEYFSWFHDEISYSAPDFVGKSIGQIREMHRIRDMRYLRS